MTQKQWDLLTITLICVSAFLAGFFTRDMIVQILALLP
jgi:hypothetical protein